MDVVCFFAVSIVLVGFVGVILVVMVFLVYGLIALVVVARCGTIVMTARAAMSTLKYLIIIVFGLVADFLNRFCFKIFKPSGYSFF